MPPIRKSPARRRLRWPSLLSTGAVLAASWLSPVSAQEKSAADYYVHSLPGAPDPLLRMFAGHIEVTPEHSGNLFFWLFKNRHIADRQRTVLWLNGGPGCSSMDGALMEVGPYRVNEDGSLRLNKGSWDEFSNVLFVDNPVGTGFSYVDTDSYVHELGDMASQMITFLEKFFTLFPEHAHDDLYIAGESYAGQHIPYVAQAIIDRNALNPQHPWNLSGLMIGNGWISGSDQYISYIPFAYETDLIQAGSEKDEQLQRQQERCLENLNSGGADHVDTSTCEGILQDMLRVTSDDNRCVNMYDVRLRDSYPSCGMNWPSDLAQVTPYLRRNDVIQSLHINPDKKTGWTECSGQVSSAFGAFNSKPSKELLPGLLEKMPIILFSGDKDLICNHIGTENLINNMDWNGGTGMEMSPGVWAPKRDWTFEGEPAGIYQTARNLTYIRFYNSSHMVPFDYPRRTRDMLDRFIGVDIASIGGTPADSRIDGEKAHPETSVGGHPNSTVAEEAAKGKLSKATWAAYRRSGEMALVIVLIAALAWGFFIYRGRRRRAGYRGVYSSNPYDGPHDQQIASGLGLDGSTRHKWRETRDVEAARDFDEAELDDLSEQREALMEKRHRDLEGERFGWADDDGEDEEDGRVRANGHAS